MVNNEVVAELRKDYIYNLVIQGKRIDGRAFDEIRDITLETGIIRKAEGSARVMLGDTQVMVGIKMQPGEPFADTPNSGVIITNLELRPGASPYFEIGPPTEDAIELARVVDRGIRESKCIDLHKLCITPGEQVWILFIDIHVIDDCGNIMDASSLGAIAALFNAKIPAERYNIGTDEPLPLRGVPIAITLADVGGKLLVDPVHEESQVADSQITIITNNDGSIAGMQKSGTGILTPERLKEAVSIAKRKAQEVRERESVRKAFLTV
ncbi:MAG: exosome complex protein Rrp42 [Methermicoccaceae archaeon]